MRRLRYGKKALFTVLTLVVGFALFEAGARLVESWWPQDPVEARSLLKFQQDLEGGPADSLPDRAGVMPRFTINGAEVPGQWFYEEKPKDEIRIVLLGGSAVVGVGIAPPATFAGIAQRLLNENNRQHTFRVINLARIGFAGAHLAYLNEKYLPLLKPDLVIVLLGNNEYLDVSGFFGEKSWSPRRWIFAQWLERNLALARLARPKIKDLPENQVVHQIPNLPDKPEIHAFVRGRLRRSVGKIIDDSRKYGARVMVCTVPVNLKFNTLREWFFAESESGYPEQFQMARWALRYGAPELAVKAMDQRLLEKPDDTAARLIMGLARKATGRTEQGNELLVEIRDKLVPEMESRESFEDRIMVAMAVRELEGENGFLPLADKILDRIAVAPPDNKNHWLAGMVLSMAGRSKAALAEFQKGVDENPGHIRADSEVNQILMAIAKKKGVDGFDLVEKFSWFSPQGISGFDLFLDYCHYNVRGHILVAHLLSRRIYEQLGLPPTIPPPGLMLATEAQLRKGRTTDLPDYNWWAGVDFDVTRLVDEMWKTPNVLRSDLEKQISDQGPSALSHCFTGNWRMAYDLFYESEKVTKDYQEALSMDPTLTAAKNNLTIRESLLNGK